MSNYNFKKDFFRSKKNEEEVIESLKRTLDEEFKNKDNLVTFTKGNKTSDYDIEMVIYFSDIDLSYSFLIELKEDFYCKKSGNVAIELSYKGRPSGINNTKADLWVYSIHTKENGIERYIFKTEALKKLIEDKVYHSIKVGGDEGSKTNLALFKYEELINYGDKLL